MTIPIRARSGRWALLLGVLLIAALVLGILMHGQRERARLNAQLLSLYPQDVASHPALVRFAIAQARPLYEKHCAACHGRNMQGNPAIGAANLVDGDWIWGRGTVFQIERIILYGIRSGNPQALGETDMPAFGLMGRLSPAQINELVQYLLRLNHRPYDAEAANAGQALFNDVHYGCYDCHGADAHGNPDYGAPNLTVNEWNNGGDPQSIYDSIYYGRHRIMPAWGGVLSLAQIRALAVYLHVLSQDKEHSPQPDSQAALSADTSGGPGVAR
jgi:cytochrome c oxidase cbb3-type subunit 3